MNFLIRTSDAQFPLRLRRHRSRTQELAGADASVAGGAGLAGSSWPCGSRREGEIMHAQVDATCRRVHVSGELDVAAGDVLAEVTRFAAELWDGDLVLDVAQVSFVDAAGLAALARAQRCVPASQARVLIDGASPRMRWLCALVDYRDLLRPALSDAECAAADNVRRATYRPERERPRRPVAPVPNPGRNDHDPAAGDVTESNAAGGRGDVRAAEVARRFSRRLRPSRRLLTVAAGQVGR